MKSSCESCKSTSQHTSYHIADVVLIQVENVPHKIHTLKIHIFEVLVNRSLALQQQFARLVLKSLIRSFLHSQQ